MFKLSRRGALLRASIIGGIVACVTMVGLFIINKIIQANAITPAGEEITVAMDYTYSTPDLGSNGHYIIKLGQGNEIEAFCSEPSKDNPSGPNTAEYLPTSGEKYELIRLMAYIYQHDATAKSDVLSAWTSDDWYAWTHMIIGVLYTDYQDYKTASAENVAKINAAITKLKNNYYDNNSNARVAAANYQLFLAPGSAPDEYGPGRQSVIWIEDNTQYGEINVQKCDDETQLCTAQTGATFADIEFKIYNNSGRKIYIPARNAYYSDGDLIDTGRTDASGKLKYSNLLANNVTYRIVETATNSSYQNTSSPATATLNGNGDSKEVKFYNKIVPAKGKITVIKRDADTGGCTSVGDASLSGTRFRLLTTGGAQVAESGISAECKAEFNDVPIGEYVVEESVVGNGYTNTASKRANVTRESLSITLTFDNTPIYGSINVSKKDNTTGNCTTVGNATFAGTTFEIINRSNNSIKYNGSWVEKDRTIASASLANDCDTITFSNLPYGKYEIKETSAGRGYTLNTNSQTVTIANGSVNPSISFTNTPIYGDLTVNKVDAETGECKTVGRLSFDGTTFQVINDSNKAIYYDGRNIGKGQEIAKLELSNGSCSAQLTGLPYGKYIVKETKASTGYTLNTNSFTVNLPADGTDNVHVSTTIANQVIRGDVTFVKMDEVNNKPMRDVLFSISEIDENNQVGESHLVMTDQNGVIDTRSSFNLHSFKTNYYDFLYDEADSFLYGGYGTWFGLASDGTPLPVNDDLGALPYGTYLIQELKCGSTLFCYGVMNQKATITIDTANQVVDLHDWNNTCAKFSLDTEAVDGEDGDKFVEYKVGQEAQIVDKISYCVKPRYNFTLKGVLMDKSTGEKVLIDGKPVEETMDLYSEDECGEVEMTFTADVSELAGKELVVFETLYYKDDIIITHDDINDASQTIEVISITTYATNKENGEKTIPHDQQTEVKDVVRYCLKPGVEYAIKGIVMNKDTKAPLLINDQTVEQELTFTPTETCGEFEMYYPIDTTGLAGARLIVFESLYIDDELILKHEDFNNADESFEVSMPVPDTGVFTSIVSGQNGAPLVITIAIVTISAVGFVGYSIKKNRSQKVSFDRK